MGHKNKEIDAALDYAISKGWKVIRSTSNGHAWGQMYCPNNSESCRCGEYCIKSIWSTPKNAHNHAAQLKRVVDNCIFVKNENAENEEESP